MNSTKKLQILLLVFLMSSVAKSQQPKNKQIFNYAVQSSAPYSIDPIDAGYRSNSAIISIIYDTLYEYKYLADPYELKPNLATSMPIISKDKKIYLIELKKVSTLLMTNASKIKKLENLLPQTLFFQ